MISLPDDSFFMTPEDRESLLKFVRDIVSELFGDIPATEPDVPDDVIGAIESASRAYAVSALGDSEPASRVADAVVLYSFAVSAVRWGQCQLSASDPMFAGRLISEMALRTGSAPKDVSAIADQLRLAPYRAKELVHMRDHILPDGSVDFSAWESGSEDPSMVRFMASLS